MTVRLSCVDAVPTARDVRLSALPATIGRGEEATVCILDNWASRVHCELFARDRRLWIRDLESSNGTRVNGEPAGEQELPSGSEISVGITTFRVTYSRLPATQSAPASEMAGA